jgi:DNA-binding XRE family transcriptional regulator
MSPAQQLAASKNGKVRRVGHKRPGFVWKCNLGRERAKLGLSSYDVAEAVGVRHQTILNAESGCDTHLSTARKIADFFGVAIEAMWPEMIKDDVPAQEQEAVTRD